MYEREFWQIVAQGLLRSDFEWLEPLRAFVSSIIIFGCWDNGDTNRGCREPWMMLQSMRIAIGNHFPPERDRSWVV
jgi:hypothetical protein